MSTTGIGVVFRPLRIGWCIRQERFDQLRLAIRTTTMVWGGKFNPILVVDDSEHAARLARLFRVDALYALEHDDLTDAFLAANPHIGWPIFTDDLLLDKTATFSGREHCAVVDVHAALDARQKARINADVDVGGELLPRWSDEDPLADLMLATFGAYRDDAWGTPFADAFTSTFGKQRRTLDHGEPLPPTMVRQASPLALTDYMLRRSRGGLSGDGVFVGSANSFEDIVEFWNLGATDHSLLFFDPAHRARLGPLITEYVALIKQAIKKMPENAWNARLGVWMRGHDSPLPDEFEDVPAFRHTVDAIIWNGLNERPPVVATVGSIAIANIANDTGRPSLAFQPEVPEPLRGLRHARQVAVMTVRPHSTFFERDGFTFAAPNVPELNEYYGRTMIMRPGHVRVEADGLGIIGEVDRSFTTLYSLSVPELFAKLFAAFGVKTKPSRSGTIARQLLRQMGGLDGCRVFKIWGVRNLINGFSAQRAFTRLQALKYIGPNFEAYCDLFIEPRESYPLTPNDAFRYLVRKGVLRPGLGFVCPTCQLEFWTLLDDARVQMKCQFCDAEFNAGVQLRDNDGWKYRRSGLFGFDNHQEGGVPVTLVLQRFETSVSDLLRANLYTTALEVEQGGPISRPCEIDFAFLAHDASGRPQLAIGEAKAAKAIDETDVANLIMIAGAFPRKSIDVFPTFAKAEEFSDSELERLVEANDVYPKRRILLSKHELEPYELFDRLKALPSGRTYAQTLEELADATHVLYSALARTGATDAADAVSE